jgi:hypothetical protein
VGSGTDVSIASADIVLIGGELMRVRDAGRLLARRTLRTIRQNIGLSIAYNLIMVPLAMAALITPLVAAISMPLSSLAVIGNSARIRRDRRVGSRIGSGSCRLSPSVAGVHGRVCGPDIDADPAQRRERVRRRFPV